MNSWWSASSINSNTYYFIKKKSWNIRVPPRPLPEAILTAVLHVHNLKLKRSSDKEKTVVEYLGSALVNLRESTTVPVDYILGSNGELTRSDLDKKSDPMEIVVEIVRSPFVPSEISDVYRLGPKAPQVDWGPSGVEWREEDDVEVVKKLARICSVEGRMLWREIREISGVIVLSMVRDTTLPNISIQTHRYTHVISTLTLSLNTLHNPSDLRPPRLPRPGLYESSQPNSPTRQRFSCTHGRCEQSAGVDM